MKMAVPMTTAPKKPNMVFNGHGKCKALGIPKRAPASALRTLSPPIHIITGIRSRDAVGKMEYKAIKNDAFNTLSAGPRFRNHKPNTIPHTKANPTVKTCVAIPAHTAKLSTIYMPRRIAT
ncbi:MAG: hypothetical protein KAT11_04670 [Phycisphaerae bacterium]|nr:hypothetical protein [Phycisphaerae bacterium]